MASRTHWRSVIAKYSSYGPEDEASDFERGRNEGAHAVGKNAAQLLYSGEQRLLLEVRGDAEDYKASFGEELGHALSDLNKVSQRQAAFTERLHGEQVRHGERQLSLDRTLGPGSEKRRQSEVELAQNQEFYDRRKSELDRPPIKPIPGRAYWPAVLTLASIEVPINALAFGLLAQITNALLYIYAIFIGIFLIGASHFFGESIKFASGSKNFAQISRNISIAVLSFIVVALVIIVVSYMRDQLLSAEGSSPLDAISFGSSFQDIVRDVAAFQIGTWLTGLSSDALQLAFFNGAIAFAAAVLAANHVDPDQRYDAATNAFRASQSNLNKIKQTYEAKSDQLAEEFAQSKAALQRAQSSLSREKSDAEEQVTRLTSANDSGSKSILRVAERRRTAYRQGFLQEFGSRGGEVQQLLSQVDWSRDRVKPDQTSHAENDVSSNPRQP